MFEWIRFDLLKLERLSRTSRLEQPEISALERLWFIYVDVFTSRIKCTNFYVIFYVPTTHFCVWLLNVFGSTVHPTAVRLFDYSTVRQFDCLTVRSFDCSTVPPFDCSTVPPLDCWTVRQFDCSTVRQFDCSTVRLFDCSTVRLFYSSTVRQFDCSTVRQFDVWVNRRDYAAPVSILLELGSAHEKVRHFSRALNKFYTPLQGTPVTCRWFSHVVFNVRSRHAQRMKEIKVGGKMLTTCHYSVQCGNYKFYPLDSKENGCFIN